MIAIADMPPPPACIAPSLVGLTERAAARRARQSGCRIVLRGASLRQPEIQTVAAQMPRSGARAAVLTLWLNPLCVRSGLPGPPHDQGRRRGPTELITGLFIEGGPAVQYSTPGCRYRHRPASPVAGTIEVLSDTGNVVVRSRTITRGRYLTVRLPPGRYRVTGDLTPGGGTLAARIRIRAGFTTRRYVVEPVP
jgi:hypothetical protein